MMSINKKYKSEAFSAVHSTALALHAVGVIKKTTMKGYDALCIKPIDLDPSTIRRIREANDISQPVFAAYLNVSVSMIEKWVSGDSVPKGATCRLISVVEKHGIEVLN